jgi:hypothetical protein
MESRLSSAACAQSGIWLTLPVRTLLLAAALGFSSASGAVLIDFDTLPGGGTLASNTVLTDQYAASGVSFSAFEEGSEVGTIVHDDGTTGAGNSGNQWFNCYPDFCTNKADVLRITFAAPVNNVQWYTDSRGNPGGDQIRFEAYDASDNLLQTVNVGNTGLPNSLLTSFSVSNVSRIDAFQPTDNWGWSMDNLSFDVTTVPLPAAVFLFGSGLIGLIGIARGYRAA